MSEYGTPYLENRLGAVVLTVAYTLIAVTIVLAIARFYASLRWKYKVGFDGLAFLLANFIALVQSILLGQAIRYGLGKHVRDLSSTSLDRYFKYDYIAQLLAVAAQGLAKVTFVSVIARVDKRRPTQQICYSILVLSLAWTLFALFTIAFQCGLPHPWVFSRKRCTAGGNLYYPVIVLNILTDAFLALFFLPVIWRLRMDKSERWKVIVLFGSRVSVCGFAIGSAYVLHSYIFSSDITFDAVVPTILNQLVMNTSIISAALPNIHRLLAQLQTGQLIVVIPENEFNMTAAPKYWRRPRRPRRPANYTSTNDSSKATTSQSGNWLNLTPDNYGQSSTHISVTRNPESLNGESTYTDHITEDDVTEDGSTRSLNRYTVRRTREVVVRYE